MNAVRRACDRRATAAVAAAVAVCVAGGCSGACDADAPPPDATPPEPGVGTGDRPTGPAARTRRAPRAGAGGNAASAGQPDGKAERLVEAVRRGELRLIRLPAGTEQQRRNLDEGKALLQAGDKEAAAAHFEAASHGEVSGARVSALLALGDLERDRGRASEAVRLHEQAAAIAPGVPEVQLQLGRAYLAVDRPRDAEEALVRATRLEPRLLAGWVELGALRSRDGRAAEAAEAFLTYERYLFDLVGRLQSGDEGDRIAAVEALSLAGRDEKAVAALVRSLADPHPAVRAAAAEALGDTSDPTALASVTAALATEAPGEVRAALTQAAARLRAALTPAGPPAPPVAPSAPSPPASPASPAPAEPAAPPASAAPAVP